MDVKLCQIRTIVRMLKDLPVSGAQEGSLQCNNDTLRSIYFAYFHSIASYGIIFGGNSSYSKKRIIRIMVGAHPRTS